MSLLSANVLGVGLLIIKSLRQSYVQQIERERQSESVNKNVQCSK